MIQFIEVAVAARGRRIGTQVVARAASEWRRAATTAEQAGRNRTLSLQFVVHYSLWLTPLPSDPMPTLLVRSMFDQDGTPISTAVRAALIEAARRKAAVAIRAEAEELAADELDRAEAMKVLRDMETLRAW